MRRIAIAGAAAFLAHDIAMVSVDPVTRERLDREREEREAERQRQAKAAPVDPNAGRPLTRQQRRRLERPWKKKRGGRQVEGEGDGS